MTAELQRTLTKSRFVAHMFESEYIIYRLYYLVGLHMFFDV